MLDQKVLLIAIIIAGVMVFADVMWRAVYSIKHKGDEKALEVMTKAQAASSWTLWMWFISGSALSAFIFKEGTVFSLNNLGTLAFFLLGMQCFFELCAGSYYAKLAQNKKTDIGQAKAEKA